MDVKNTGSWALFKGLYQTRLPNPYNYYDEQPECDCVHVWLGDTFYEFFEDPGDGYRSFCRITSTCARPENSTFALEKTPVRVWVVEGSFEPESEYADEPFEGLVLIGDE